MKFYYACVNRPPFCAAPKGYEFCEDFPFVALSYAKQHARHGVISYERELSRQECYNYELIQIVGEFEYRDVCHDSFRYTGNLERHLKFMELHDDNYLARRIVDELQRESKITPDIRGSDLMGLIEKWFKEWYMQSIAPVEAVE